MKTASDEFSYDDLVKITLDCPLKGMVGNLTYISEDSLQVEVHIDLYDEDERECTSYFRGFATDVSKVN